MQHDLRNQVWIIMIKIDRVFYNLKNGSRLMNDTLNYSFTRFKLYSTQSTLRVHFANFHICFPSFQSFECHTILFSERGKNNKLPGLWAFVVLLTNQQFLYLFVSPANFCVGCGEGKLYRHSVLRCSYNSKSNCSCPRCSVNNNRATSTRRECSA